MSRLSLPPSSLTMLRVFVPFALGYFLSYAFRVVNALLAPELTAELDLDASILGLLTSAYFLTFAAFQLPLGVLLDRFGPRRTESVLLIIAALGALGFASADSASGLVIARGLIGLGVSACLMAAFKAYTIWFAAERLPMINGIHMAIGGLGALVATKPVELALHATNWRGVFIILGVATLAVAALQFFIVPERAAERENESLGDQVLAIKHIFASRRFWRIAPWATSSQATGLAIHTLWVGPWLRDVIGLDRAAVGNYLALIVVALIAGFVMFGVLASRLTRIGIQPMHVAVAGMTAFMIIQLTLVLGVTTGALGIWMLFTLVASTGIICYPALAQDFPQELAGRVITSLNVLVFTAAFAAQWGIGALINLWPAGDGAYAPFGYRVAFGITLATQAVSAVWYCWLAPRDECSNAPFDALD